MSYYQLNKEWFKEYYKAYYIKHRQEQIDKATIWNAKHPDRHAIACHKYLMANKKLIYSKQRIKNIYKKVMRELLNELNK
jgi:hypothetical protein